MTGTWPLQEKRCCSCRVRVCRCRGCCSLSVCMCVWPVDLFTPQQEKHIISNGLDSTWGFVEDVTASERPYVYLHTYIYIHPYLYIYIYIYIYIYVYVYVYTYLSIYLSIWLSIYLSVFLSVFIRPHECSLVWTAGYVCYGTQGRKARKAGGSSFVV